MYVRYLLSVRWYDLTRYTQDFYGNEQKDLRSTN